jgi:hypothetical protein
MPIWLLLFGTFVILLLIRVPLGFSLGIATLVTMAYDGLPLESLAVTYFPPWTRSLLWLFRYFYLPAASWNTGAFLKD